MKKLLLSAIAMMLVVTSFAQEKKFLTPVDASYNNRSVYPVGKSYKWLGDTDKFVFTEGDEIQYRSPGEKSAHTLLSLETLNGIAKGGLGEFKRLPNITWIDENSGYFYKRNNEESMSLNLLNINDKSITTITVIPANAENITLNEKTMKVAYTIGNDLYVANGRSQIRLTENPEHVII